MGIVYEAFDPGIERRVAIKVIRPDMLDQAQAGQIIQRFKREAQSGGRLSHPNIVAVYEYGEEDHAAFIAMEYVEGRGLKAAKEAGEAFGVVQILQVMAGLLRGLDHAHRRGVVHRDIKPANIIVTPHWQIKIADFGLARLDTSQLTQLGDVMGTPMYMSPEQVRGLDVDGRTDLFSAGVIFYEFLTGLPPFKAPAIATVLHQVLELIPPPPIVVNPTVPAALSAVAEKALAKNASDRYQTAAEFLVALRTALQAQLATPSDATIASGPQQPLEEEFSWLAAGSFDEGFLSRVEVEMTRFIGPMARMFVRRASDWAMDKKDLFYLLAEEVPPAARAGFLKRMESLAPESTPSSPRASVSPAPVTGAPAWDRSTLAAVEQKLTTYIGPVARIVVKREAAVAHTLKALHEALAAHIDDERERRAFLASLKP
jgi:serine/threonine protein kinase